jgi:hypothetical protein
VISEELLGALQASAPGVGASLVLVGALGARASAAALGVALWATYAFLMAVPEWPHELWTGSNDGKQWLVWAVVLAALLATLAAWRSVSRPVVRIASPVLIGASVWFMLTNLRARAGTPESVAKVALGSALSIALWAATRPLLARRPGLLVPIGYCAAFGADGWLLLGAGSAFLGQLAGACSAALGTAAAIAWLRRGAAFDAELSLPLALAHGGLLLAGHEFADLGTAAALAALAAPALLWLAAGRGAPRGRAAAGLTS